MQKTKIFVSFSADSLKQDVLETESFIRRLNDCYLDKGHYFTPILDETISDDATGETEIADCALAFFLAEASSTELPETYKTALNSYNKTGKPRIFTYMKIQELGAEGQRADSTQELGDDGPRQCSVVSDQRSADEGNTAASTRSSVSNSTLHTQHSKLNGARSSVSNSKLQTPNSTLFPPRPYTHPDTLKLEILMQIKQLGLDGVDIHLEDGKAWQGNTVLLSLENVEAVSGYENLQNLKQKRAALESRYYAAKTRHAENPDDTEAYEAFFEASKQRSEALQEIRDIEAQLYHMMEGMYEQTSHGKLTTRQAEGYRLIERGLLNEARTVLDFDAIISESRHHEELAEQAAKRAQDSVNELMQLKDVNATLLDWDAVDACYKEAVRLEEKYDLPRRAAISLNPIETDYLNFLIYQYRHDEAVVLGERLRAYYRNPENCNRLENMSYVLNLLGVIYYETQRMDKSEEALNAALEIRRARTEGDQNAIDKDISIVYNNLGNMYYFSKRFEEAIEAHSSALKLRKGLAKRAPDVYNEYLGYSFVNLGAVYDELEKPEESAELMAAACVIFKSLAISKPYPHSEYLSVSYHNLGVAYTRLHRLTEAEEQFIAALEIQLRLADDNPGAYEFRVAESYNEYGNLLLKTKRYPDAYEKYSKAVALYKKLSESNPDMFEPLLAGCYSNLGGLLVETEHFSEAETSFETASLLYEKYSEDNPAYTEKASEARKSLDGIKYARSFEGGAYSQLTPDEREIALLIIDGDTKHDVARKLHLSAAEAAEKIGAIREKVIRNSDPNPVIAAVVTKFGLSNRQTEILRCLSLNMTNSEISAALLLAEENIRVHLHNLIKKLPVENRADIPAWLNGFRG